MFIPKVIEMCEKSIHIRKTRQRKGGSESFLDTKIVARVIAYCMFTDHYLSSKGAPINPNFDDITERMKGIVLEYLDRDALTVLDDPDNEARKLYVGHKWRFAIEWGLHFLSCPVPIVNYKNMPGHMLPDNYMSTI